MCLIRTLDKFLAPSHAAAVFEKFYFMQGLGTTVMYLVGAAELVIIVGFVLGFDLYYGRVGGCIVSGNEDGVKALRNKGTVCIAASGLYGSTSGRCRLDWRGGPGPSYADEDSGGGPQNDFTQRNTTFMTWNLMHMARLLRAAGGVPAHGNQRSEWDAGCRSDHPNADYR